MMAVNIKQKTQFGKFELILRKLMSYFNFVFIARHFPTMGIDYIRQPLFKLNSEVNYNKKVSCYMKFYFFRRLLLKYYLDSYNKITIIFRSKFADNDFTGKPNFPPDQMTFNNTHYSLILTPQFV